jgi:hypothetical protein
LSDIFNEVDEDLRRDRAERLWKKYGNYVLAAAVAIVAATAGWTWWTDHQRRQAAAEGDRFFAALAQMDPAQPGAAAEKFAAIGREAKSGYRTVSLLNEAGLKARAKDVEGALALYRSVAADGAADPDLRDAATLLGALVAIETLKPTEIDAMLAGLQRDGSAWRFTALEISAVAALRSGNAARARELYTRVADDPAAPASLRARAAEMTKALGAGAGT